MILFDQYHIPSAAAIPTGPTRAVVTALAVAAMLGISIEYCPHDRMQSGERKRAKAAPPARKPRKPTLISVAKQASKAAIAVARYEVEPDGTVVVVTGTPEPTEPDNAWPLDEFRTKETKQ